MNLWSQLFINIWGEGRVYVQVWLPVILTRLLARLYRWLSLSLVGSWGNRSAPAISRIKYANILAFFCFGEAEAKFFRKYVKIQNVEYTGGVDSYFRKPTNYYNTEFTQKRRLQFGFRGIKLRWLTVWKSALERRESHAFWVIFERQFQN